MRVKLLCSDGTHSSCSTMDITCILAVGRSGWKWKYHKITETIRYKIARERIIAVERIHDAVCAYIGTGGEGATVSHDCVILCVLRVIAVCPANHTYKFRMRQLLVHRCTLSC